MSNQKPNHGRDGFIAGVVVILLLTLGISGYRAQFGWFKVPDDSIGLVFEKNSESKVLRYSSIEAPGAKVAGGGDTHVVALPLRQTVTFKVCSVRPPKRSLGDVMWGRSGEGGASITVVGAFTYTLNKRMVAEKVRSGSAQELQAFLKTVIEEYGKDVLGASLDKELSKAEFHAALDSKLKNAFIRIEETSIQEFSPGDGSAKAITEVSAPSLSPMTSVREFRWSAFWSGLPIAFGILLLIGLLILFLSVVGPVLG